MELANSWQIFTCLIRPVAVKQEVREESGRIIFPVTYVEITECNSLPGNMTPRLPKENTPPQESSENFLTNPFKTAKDLFPKKDLYYSDFNFSASLSALK